MLNTWSLALCNKALHGHSHKPWLHGARLEPWSVNEDGLGHYYVVMAIGSLVKAHGPTACNIASTSIPCMVHWQLVTWEEESRGMVGL